jgi:GntR family transcriptional regulator, transcriptional repressor for pyruvate dehydrogenase complex
MTPDTTSPAFAKLGAIAPAEQRSRTDTITDHVLDLVQTGSLNPGDRLPPEGDLAVAFGVSRTVVREAMKALEAVGVVRIEQGRGTFIAQNPLAHAFSLWATMNLHRFDEMYEVRKLIEAETAFRAASRATAADRVAMHQALATYREALAARDWARLVAADCGFHLAIANACGLHLLAEMLAVTVPVWTNVQPHTDFDRAVASGAEHDRVMAAIDAADDAAARRAMVVHVEGAYRRLHEAAHATKEGGHDR